MKFGFLNKVKSAISSPEEVDTAAKLNSKSESNMGTPIFTHNNNQYDKLPRLIEKNIDELHDSMPLNRDLFTKRDKRDDMSPSGKVEEEQDQSRNYEKDSSLDKGMAISFTQHLY